MKYRIVEKSTNGKVKYYIEKEIKVKFWIPIHAFWIREFFTLGYPLEFNTLQEAKDYLQSLEDSQNYTKILEELEL